MIFYVKLIMSRLIGLYLLFVISITITHGFTSETNQTINLINLKFKDCGKLVYEINFFMFENVINKLY